LFEKVRLLTLIVIKDPLVLGKNAQEVQRIPYHVVIFNKTTGLTSKVTVFFSFNVEIRELYQMRTRKHVPIINPATGAASALYANSTENHQHLEWVGKKVGDHDNIAALQLTVSSGLALVSRFDLEVDPLLFCR
jgi:hypothetical protein